MMKTLTAGLMLTVLALFTSADHHQMRPALTDLGRRDARVEPSGSNRREPGAYAFDMRAMRKALEELLKQLREKQAKA